MKKLTYLVLFALFFTTSAISQIDLIFPYNNETLTDFACSWKAKITSGGPYELQLSRNQNFSNYITREPQGSKYNANEVKDDRDIVYFLSSQGTLVPGERWILETGVWYWRITANNGNSVSETRKLTVTDNIPAKQVDREISPQKPLFHLRLRRSTNNPASDVSNLVPNEFKDNIVINIGLLYDFLHDGELDLYKYAKKFNDTGYKFAIDFGYPSNIDIRVSLGEIEKIYKDLPNFVGGEMTEMFYNNRETDIDHSHIYGALKLSRKYGKYMFHADMNWKNNKWLPFSYEMYDFIKDNYSDYYIPALKGTEPFGTYTVISTIQGMKLSGMAKNIGMWSDMWSWEKFGPVNTFGIDKFLESTHGTGQQEDFPYMQHMKQYIYAMTYGGTVFGLEPAKQWSWESPLIPNDLYHRYLMPFIEAVVRENIIPSERAINDNFHVVVDPEISTENPGETPVITYMEGNVWGDFLRNTFGISDINGYDTEKSAFGTTIKRSAYIEISPNTDRYPSGIPFLAKSGLSAPVVNGRTLDVVKISDMTNKANVDRDINKYYPESTNEAFATKIDQSIFIFNTVENHDVTQSYSIPLNFAGIENIHGDIHLMSYVIGRMRSDGKTLFIQANAYKKGGSGYSSDYDYGRYNLPTYKSVIKFKATSRPTLSSDKMGAINTNWNQSQGVLTVEIDHDNAGAVNFTITGDGNPIETYPLSVVSGSGNGNYTEGANISVTADNIAGKAFVSWTGDVSNLANTSASTTTLTMPSAPVSITANYIDVQTHRLNVENGSGDGDYEEGANVPILADAAPIGQVFDVWTGDVSAVSNVNNASTTITMPAGGATITATYKLTSCQNTTESTIEAENFDNMHGIDTETCTEGGENVGWVDANDWLEYCVEIPTSGNYLVDLRLATSPGTGIVEIQIDGTTQTSVDVPATGGWQAWETATSTEFGISAGTHIIKLIAAEGGFNLNWLSVKAGGTPLVEYALSVNSGSGDGNYVVGTNVSITANAALAGQEFDVWTGDVSAVANVNNTSTTVTMPAAAVSVTATYKPISSTCTNAVNATIEAEAYEAMSGIQTEDCSEGGLNVGWIDDGDWMEYCINIPNSGNYEVDFRVASANGSGTVEIQIDGAAKTSVNVTNSSGWQDWTTVRSSSFYISSGTHTIKLNATKGGFNINWLLVKSGETQTQYSLTVNSGSGSGNYTAGTAVSITANAAPSGQVFDVWTGDVGGIANVNNSSTTISMPSQATTVTATYKIDGGGSGEETLSAINDAYLQGSTNYNANIIRIESGNRVGYLMFDLSTVSGTINTVQLKLTCNGDGGSGNINIDLGNSSSWTETTLSTSNAPVSSGLLGSLNTSYSVGNTYTWELNANSLSGGGIVSMIVSQTNGNDAAFASKENSVSGPELVINYGGTKSSDSPNDRSNSEISGFILYPNPNYGILNIQFDAANYTVAVYNTLGRIIHSVENLSGNQTLDISDISKGIYFIRIESESENFTRRLVIK